MLTLTRPSPLTFIVMSKRYLELDQASSIVFYSDEPFPVPFIVISHTTRNGSGDGLINPRSFACHYKFQRISPVAIHDSRDGFVTLRIFLFPVTINGSWYGATQYIEWYDLSFMLIGKKWSWDLSGLYSDRPSPQPFIGTIHFHSQL